MESKFSLTRLTLVFLWATLSAWLGAAPREVVLLYTNDFHSAVDPIPAYWMKGTPHLGGAAQLSTLINRIRAREKTVFLFDTGDMFTGMLSFLTRGEALMEMMAAFRYDAMAIGNHEFDYGASNFEKQMYRVSFPILGANIYYKSTRHSYARPSTIVRRNGVRVGVVGVIGKDARSVALPSGITELEFTDPVQEVSRWVSELRDQVDLMVVLTHQGKTGPMQTDAEAHPDLQRDFDEDIRLAGAVDGIDVLVGGHAHRGIETPYVHPRTGTLIVQTYGYGTRLGFLKLWLDQGRVVRHEGELIKVFSDELEPDPKVVACLRPYRHRLAAQVGEVLTSIDFRMIRGYRSESVLGDFVTDVMRRLTGAEVGLTNAGGLRADLPRGPVTRGNVLDALPFENSLVEMQLSGRQIREILEQGLTLERGMIQVSGLRAVYDLARPRGSRLLEFEIGDDPVQDQHLYQVVTNSFLAQGGDLYQTFLQGRRIHDSGELLSAAVIRFLKGRQAVPRPVAGRLVPLSAGREDSGRRPR
ncbi:MAG: bifunctional metallophosphatase/5'-nucleotidase [Acidobacteriota bacterium]